jgi:hypothetical protein
MEKIETYKQGIMARLESGSLAPGELYDIADWIDTLNIIEGFMGKNDKLSNIKGEIAGAEKYYKLWRDTGDQAYKDMGLDEIRHAESLIKMLPEGLPPKIAEDLKKIKEKFTKK